MNEFRPIPPLKKEPPPQARQLADVFETPALDVSVCEPPRDLRTLKIPPQEYAIATLYPRRMVTAFVGAGKLGKSTLLLRQLIYIAAGRTWEGLPTAHGKAYYFSAEDEAERVWERCQAVINGEMFTDEEFAAFRRNFRLIDARGKNCYFVAATSAGVMPSNVTEEIARIVGKDAVAVAVETLSRVLPLSENENNVMSTIVKACEIGAQLTGAAWILVHHVSKAGVRNNTPDGAAHRGGQALADNTRSYVHFGPHDNDDSLLVLTHVHCSYGPRSAPSYWRRLGDGRLVRHEPPVADPMRDLREWFIGPRKSMPFTISEASRKHRSEWTSMGRPAAETFIRKAVQSGALVEKVKRKGSACYVPASDDQDALAAEFEL